MKYINTGMEYINTGNPVMLKTLISSGDITDRTIIQIFDSAGAFLTRGNWYQDQVLDYLDGIGTAKKPGTGITVNFKLL